ncbi:hypothetical protein Glove_480g18 [Diversispora epigaea]|uniref:Uncharacterized protein n=1 Tax=Diversispora epigaea TaxID=1348612 RepID=A0A397GLE5_9GLOM|nr:hypothetical protein Glove_480g18 [Diversispora epigaea]
MNLVFNVFLSLIEDSPSKAINSLYHKIFNTNTEYSGLAAIGFENKEIIKRLIENIKFFPIFLKIEQFLTVVSGFGYSEKEENYYTAGSGYISSIVARYKGQKHLFLLKVQKDECQIEVYQEETHIKTFSSVTPDIVWNKIGIFQKFSGSYIFGITHKQVQKQLQNLKNEEFLICTSNRWDNQELMNEAFARHIKSRKIPNTMNDWQKLFLNWKSQKSSIILFPKILESIYPINYQFQDKELSAWRSMFRACGCTDVTPYHRKLSKTEFWSNAQDPQSDQNTLSYLYHSDMLQIEPELFKKSLHSNKCGAEGCIRILSIIAEGFSISQLKKNLAVGSDTITNARKHARLYGPGAPPFEKPKRIVHKMAEIKEQQFLWFFQDRANISKSSYKIDPKSNLPICYLHDQKSELWKKFEETYPNGMKKTSFMTRLTNATHLKYRDDLGALCQICNDYGFESFENLESIVREDISEKKNRFIYFYCDNGRWVCAFGKINSNGTLAHNSCISHCLLYAFGDCDQIHQTRCNKCDQFFQLFNLLKNQISNDKIQKLDEIQEKLKYYLSHQTRKVYLNAQFKPLLNSLDDNGAIMICDYKMKVLPKSARETKSEFFEKNTELNISAYDHWSTDTKQDSWFTASSFEAVFDSLEKKPKWICVISDNGPHYHNSELMAIIAHWYNWYQIEIRSWTFLEPGKAKTTIDSHHAAVNEKTNQKIMNTLLKIKKDITGIKKEISEIHKSVDNSKEKNKEVEESYLNKIAQTVLKPFIETDMYPDIEKLKEETKNYLNSNDPEFLAKCSEKKWDHLFEKKIHGKMLLKLRSMRGNMVAKIKLAIFSTFGEDSLPNINNNATQKDIMNWKEKKEVRKAFEKLHKKINNDNDKETLTYVDNSKEKNKEVEESYLNKIAQTVLKPFIETDMYPDIEKLKEETKNYLNLNDPEFLAKCSEKKWDHLFEKKIHGKMLLKLRSMRGNMVAKIKLAIFSTFGEDSLPNINNNATQKDIMNWKEKKEKAFSNPDKVGKPLLVFAVGVIEIILNPDNGGIKVKDEIMKSKIRKNIDKIENGNIYISSSSLESSSESEKDNNDNSNEDNEDVGVIYIDSNEENDINLFQMDDESEME